MRGDYKGALAIQDRLMPLHTALFLDPNPAGPKYALSLIRPVTAEVRLPMVPCGVPAQKAIEAAMQHAGILN